MSKFDTAYGAFGSPALMDQFGESVTYTPVGGIASAITARVSRGLESVVDDEDQHGQGRKVFVDAKVTVKLTDVAAPGRGDKVVIDGNTYKVADGITTHTNAGEASFDVVYVTSDAVTEPGTYRRTRG